MDKDDALVVRAIKHFSTIHGATTLVQELHLALLPGFLFDYEANKEETDRMISERIDFPYDTFEITEIRISAAQDHDGGVYFKCDTVFQPLRELGGGDTRIFIPPTAPITINGFSWITHSQLLHISLGDQAHPY